jgi:hypothetical protein
LASKSIASRYFGRFAQRFDSEQVLGKEGVAGLHVVRFGRASLASRFELSIQGQHQRRPDMKKLFLAVALVVAFAAPAMAQNFVNPYSAACDACR